MIMDMSRSRMLHPINSLNIWNTLLIPSDFTQMSNEYNEEYILLFFQESLGERKEFFLKTHLNLESQLSNPLFPIYFDMFNEETQSMITLASQLLGMDLNQFVTEPLLSLIFTLISGQVASGALSHYSLSACLEFDEFLARSVNSQLINFHRSGTFSFQSLLIRMFFYLQW